MAINNYAEHCTFIENQYVEKQVVENMVVEQQSLKQPDPNVPLPTDDNVPTNYYDFISVRGLEKKKEFVKALRKAITEECSKHKNLYNTKSKVLRAVFEPLVLNDKIKRMPQAMEFQALLASAIPGGMSDICYNNFKKSIENSHRTMKNDVKMPYW